MLIGLVHPEVMGFILMDQIMESSNRTHQICDPTMLFVLCGTSLYPVCDVQYVLLLNKVRADF